MLRSPHCRACAPILARFALPEGKDSGMMANVPQIDLPRAGTERAKKKSPEDGTTRGLSRDVSTLG
jgi:hypothetical protein